MILDDFNPEHEMSLAWRLLEKAKGLLDEKSKARAIFAGSKKQKHIESFSEVLSDIYNELQKINNARPSTAANGSSKFKFCPYFFLLMRLIKLAYEYKNRAKLMQYLDDVFNDIMMHKPDVCEHVSGLCQALTSWQIARDECFHAFFRNDIDVVVWYTLDLEQYNLVKSIWQAMRFDIKDLEENSLLCFIFAKLRDLNKAQELDIVGFPMMPMAGSDFSENHTAGVGRSVSF